MKSNKNKVTKIAERLMLRLKTELNLRPFDDRCQPKTLRTGHWQKSSGAWSWEFITEIGVFGSRYTMLECLKAKTLVRVEGNTIEANL